MALSKDEIKQAARLLVEEYQEKKDYSIINIPGHHHEKIKKEDLINPEVWLATKHKVTFETIEDLRQSDFEKLRAWAESIPETSYHSKIA